MVRTMKINMKSQIVSGTFRVSIVAAVSAAILMGCNIVKPLSYVLEGPGKIEAEFELQDVVTMGTKSTSSA